MAKQQLIADLDSSIRSVKVVFRVSNMGELVRKGRATHPDSTVADPVNWMTVLNSGISGAGSIKDIAAISIASQRHNAKILKTKRTHETMVNIK